MKFTLRVCSLIGIMILWAWPLAAQVAPDENFQDSCVSDFDPETDYFPQKLSVDYAEGFTVEYFNHYKVVTVQMPWPGADAADAFSYVLVQCGTPAPEGFADAQMLEVPIGDMLALSTTYLPHLVDLELTDSLIGLDSFLYLSTPEILAQIEAGDLIEVGNGASINIELVLEAEPDIVFTYGNGLPEYDAHPILLEAGIPVGMAADFVEANSLGRAEWMKFIALFYNLDGEAQVLFGEKVAAYDALVALVADLPADARPSVLWDSYTSWGDAWFIPGEDSYIAQLLHDAGAEMILGDSPETQDMTSSVPFDFEVVYDVGLEADFWIPGSFGVNSLEDLLASDERYADFSAVDRGQVWLNNLKVNANGGNDFYETGAADPQLILADLIAIFHPELLPEHDFNYYQVLLPAS